MMDEEFLSSLPSLSSLIKANQFHFKKHLGQHFLTDRHILEKIVCSAGPLDNQHVLEVGPGIGSLTRYILAHGASHVTALDMDSHCISILNDIMVPVSEGRLRILHQDALSYDIPSHLSSDLVVIANLPYHISATLLIKWLSYASYFKTMVLMFQREVAERIMARPSTKAYGLLSVLAQYYMDVTHITHLAPTLFIPPPKVDSTVLLFRPKELSENHISYACLLRLLKSLFPYRRKTLRAIFKQIGWDPLWILDANIDPMTRPDALCIDEYVQLCHIFNHMKD